MIETIVDPFGKAAFPTIVKCDGCGEIITQCGTMCESDDGKTTLHFCDDCSSPANQDFRICMVCGQPMIEGYTDGGNFYACEKHFEKAMTETYVNWREVDDDFCDGYYEWYEPREGWCGTGIYWTTWY